MKTIACMLLLLTWGCGADETVEKAVDNDGDGYGADVDCRDFDRFSYPGAIDHCDNVDNDCDAKIDEGYDQDQDGFSSCNGDCADNNPALNPKAQEIVDGIDNDCDDIIDNHTDQFDDDGDGFTEQQGDCNDDAARGGRFISPRSIEVQFDRDGNPEGVDNDCDMAIDEAPDVLNCPTITNGDTALEQAAAIGACGYVSAAYWDPMMGGDARQRSVVPIFGSFISPRQGNEMLVLSTGIAEDQNVADAVPKEPGTNFNTQITHTHPLMRAGCSLDDPANVNDYVELEITFDAPTNAFGISFDYFYMTSHFAEYVCTQNEDTFVAWLTSGAYQGNLVFDSVGNYATQNMEFMTVCDASLGPLCTTETDLIGTGYDDAIGGGTGWLSTQAPIIPGEKLTLRFAIYEEKDGSNDSTVLIDNFRWLLDDGVTQPVTMKAQ